jgi:hypothetical protein
VSLAQVRRGVRAASRRRGGVALTVTNLQTSSTTTDATSYNTATLSPPANAVLLAGFQIGVTTGSPTAGVSGLGLTWVLVDNTTVIAGGRTTYVYRAATGGSAPTPGAVTITTGVTANAFLWNVTQFEGVDLTGTNGSGAIVQSFNSRPTAGTSVSVAYTSAPTAGNVCYALVGVAVAEAPAPGTGWASLGTGQTVTNLVNGFTAMQANPPVTNVLASWTTSAQANVVGVEVKAA